MAIVLCLAEHFPHSYEYLILVGTYRLKKLVKTALQVLCFAGRNLLCHHLHEVADRTLNLLGRVDLSATELELEPHNRDRERPPVVVDSVAQSVTDSETQLAHVRALGDDFR